MTWKINSLPLFTNLPSVIVFLCNWIQNLITKFCLKEGFLLAPTSTLADADKVVEAEMLQSSVEHSSVVCARQD